MLRRCIKTSNRAARRRAVHRARRLGIESLERRDCPAVEAFLSGGVLSVVGDEGNNIIELFQPQDRVVQVVGDGRTWLFEDVDEVIVTTGDGDDQATSSKPKEIVVVGAKIHLDAGAGNDRIKIDDGEPDRSRLPSSIKWEIAVDLGTGADELSVEADNVDSLDLDIRSADGGDSVAARHTLWIRDVTPVSTTHVNLDLAGSDNNVDLRMEEIDDVDVSIVTEP